ncbi:hypothetical protein WICPIJ_000886 [Wickerhamomyces pijperi]|uniref:Uncharacterized protein n=1 Tax=Wickerhamomyces pijperi TaxID=599730 RepID=A0A9P8TR93_WICPI|nr:hypothetical protein WICPIJ_000886 [Wickerhamomyces pijperi]
MTTRIKKQPKVEGKIIKHAPSKQFKYTDSETILNIQSKTPFISAVKRITKLLKDLPKRQPKYTYIIVKGSGRALERTLSIGIHFRDVERNKVEIFTKTLEVLDEIDAGDEDEDTVLKKRKVPSVELHIYRSVYD